MAKNTGKVLTHTYITQKVWGRSWENDIASLRVFMATLRKKLESEPDAPQYIQTHIGIGYRMIKAEWSFIQGFKVMLQFVDAKITKDEQNKNDRKCKKYQHKISSCVNKII